MISLFYISVDRLWSAKMMRSSFFAADQKKSGQTGDEQQRTEQNQCKFKTERRKRIGIGIRLGNDLFKGFRNIFPLINAS